MWKPLLKEGALVDVSLLDRLILCFNNNPSDKIAKESLEKFVCRSDVINFIIHSLESKPTPKTTFYLLLSMINYIKNYWDLENPHRNEVKEYFLNYLNVLLPTNNYENITKCNQIIVAIATAEWPIHWPELFPILFNYSTQSQELCLNFLRIISILSTDINQFALESGIKSARAGEMNAAFSENIDNILNIIMPIITNPSNHSSILVKTCLSTFLSISQRMDPSTIFTTNILSQIIDLYIQSEFIVEAILILGEVLSLFYIPDEYFEMLSEIFKVLVLSLNSIFFEDYDFNTIPEYLSGLLSITIPSFLDQYHDQIENSNYSPFLNQMLKWILLLTHVANGETFEKCVNFWHDICQRVILDLTSRTPSIYQYYISIIPEIRELLILRIVSPFEISKSDDESPKLVSYVSHGSLYHLMKETLIYITNIDSKEMINYLNHLMTLISESSEFNSNLYNSFSWTVGSMVTALNEQSDRQFILNLLEFSFSYIQAATNDEQKEIISLGTSFFCSQLTRFYIRDDELLQKVILSLFDFLGDENYNLKLFTLESFKLIINQCRLQFVKKPNPELKSIAEEIFDFYPMIYPTLPPSGKVQFIELMSKLSRSFQEEELRISTSNIIISFLDEEFLNSFNHFQVTDLSTIKQFCYCLNNHSIAATSLSIIYFNYFTQHINKLIELSFKINSVLTNILNSTTKKKLLGVLNSIEFTSLYETNNEIFILLSKFTLSGNNSEQIEQIIIKIFIEQILPQYNQLLPHVRSYKILNLLNSIIIKCGKNILNYLNPIMTLLYTPTLDMIKDNYDEFPNFRIEFYNLLLTIFRHLIDNFPNIEQEIIIEFIESVKWGASHPQHDISLICIQTIRELLKLIKERTSNEFQEQFFTYFIIDLFKFIFEILTDTRHKFAFNLEVNIIEFLLNINILYDLREQLLNQLIELFPTVHPDELLIFLTNLFLKRDNLRNLTELLEDFLITVKHILKYDPDFINERKNNALNVIKEQLKDLPGLEEQINNIDE